MEDGIVIKFSEDGEPIFINVNGKEEVVTGQLSDNEINALSRCQFEIWTGKKGECGAYHPEKIIYKSPNTFMNRLRMKLKNLRMRLTK